FEQSRRRRAMAVYRIPPVPQSQITPRSVYLNRRTLIAGALASLPVLAGIEAAYAATAPLEARPGRFGTDEKLTPVRDVTTYRNFHEFGAGKGDPSSNSGDFSPEPWSVTVDGLVAKPHTFDLDHLRRFPLEERIYRMRCV